jgi:hypothetical protein
MQLSASKLLALAGFFLAILGTLAHPTSVLHPIQIKSKIAPSRKSYLAATTVSIENGYTSQQIGDLGEPDNKNVSKHSDSDDGCGGRPMCRRELGSES